MSVLGFSSECWRASASSRALSLMKAEDRRSSWKDPFCDEFPPIPMPLDDSGVDRLKGDTLGFRGPWGTTYPANLRLLIGKMTEDQWLKYGKSLMTRPPMPWFNVRAMTEADLRAVYQYVKSMPGGAGIAAPAYVPPDKQPKPPYIQWPGDK